MDNSLLNNSDQSFRSTDGLHWSDQRKILSKVNVIHFFQPFSSYVFLFTDYIYYMLDDKMLNMNTITIS